MNKLKNLQHNVLTSQYWIENKKQMLVSFIFGLISLIIVLIIGFVSRNYAASRLIEVNNSYQYNAISIQTAADAALIMFGLFLLWNVLSYFYYKHQYKKNMGTRNFHLYTQTLIKISSMFAILMAFSVMNILIGYFAFYYPLMNS